MRPTDLKRRLQKQPFRPFRIVLSDGMTYDVRHPDQVVPWFTTVEILPLETAEYLGVDDPEVSLSYIHIVRLEPIAPDVPIQETNGMG